MYKIVEAKMLAPDIKLFRIEAPLIARKRKPGQFVILRVSDRGERVPLTIADANPKERTITIIAQGVGKTTKLLNAKNPGDYLSDVVGPLGKPTELHQYGTVVVIGGGLGTAIAYPIAKGLKQAGNKVISIIGARNQDLIILEADMYLVSDEMCVTTDDGSYGEKGFVTEKLKALIDAGRKIDLVVAVGPVPMMRAVAEVTRPYAIKTMVSLNPIMVDGTGMCGGCRVVVDGKSYFACVDGPEFDAHKVDFKVLMARNAMYQDAERTALQSFSRQQHKVENHGCKLQEKHPEVGPLAPPAV